MAAELSVCIPTRNRALFLEKCLTHLKGFRKLRLEVIVSDNASEDATAKVARGFEKAFERFQYHRHPHDVGVARNMDTALRLATAPYLWILSDDDIAYESGLVFLRDALERAPAAVAASGRYRTVGAMQVGSDRFQPPPSVLTLSKGDVAKLTGNLLFTDGHPVMRREIFQRHCRLEEGGFGLLPLYGRLLRHGDVLCADAEVMEHLMNAESLSTRLTEPWFMDSLNADIELACAGAASPVPLDAVDRARNSLLGMTYLNAARMARTEAAPLLMRHFLLRAKAIHSVSVETLVHWESAFLVAAAVQRLAQVLNDMGVKKVLLEDAPALKALTPDLETALDGVPCRSGLRGDAPRGPGEARVFMGPALPNAESGHDLCFLDVVDWCRVTEFGLRLVVDDAGSAAIAYQDPRAVRMLDQVPRGFAIIMGEYAGESA